MIFPTTIDHFWQQPSHTHPHLPLDSVCTHRLRVHGMDGEERGGRGGGGGGEEEARGEGGVEQQHHGQVQGQVGGVEHSAVQPRQPHRHPEHGGVISMQGQCNQIGFLRTLEFSTFKDINFRVDMNSKNVYKCPLSSLDFFFWIFHLILKGWRKSFIGITMQR